jgi:hypothetical protein
VKLTSCDADVAGGKLRGAMGYPVAVRGAVRAVAIRAPAELALQEIDRARGIGPRGPFEPLDVQSAKDAIARRVPALAEIEREAEEELALLFAHGSPIAGVGFGRSHVAAASARRRAVASGRFPRIAVLLVCVRRRRVLRPLLCPLGRATLELGVVAQLLDRDLASLALWTDFPQDRAVLNLAPRKLDATSRKASYVA